MPRSFLAGYFRGLTSLGEHRAVSTVAGALLLRVAICGLSELSRAPLAASLPAQYSFPGDRTSREVSFASTGLLLPPAPPSLVSANAAARASAPPSPPPPPPPLLVLLLLLPPPETAAESQSVFCSSCAGDADARERLRRDGEPPRRPPAESSPLGDLREAAATAAAGRRLGEAVEEGDKFGRFLRGRGEGVVGAEPSSASRGDWGPRGSCSCARRRRRGVAESKSGGAVVVKKGRVMVDEQHIQQSRTPKLHSRNPGSSM